MLGHAPRRVTREDRTVAARRACEMAEVVTMVSGTIDPDRSDEVLGTYREALRDGPPPDIAETFLLREEGDRLSVLSVWHRRADLEAMLASGEEPFARRLIRGAGGTPEVRILEILHHAGG
jgi:hypothetical protein